MAENNNGWQQPEEKFPETELQDSFAEFFSEEETEISNTGKKSRKAKQGPDILAVSEESDPGFVITEVVAFDNGEEVVPVKEETAEQEVEHEEAKEETAGAQAEEETEKADANADFAEDEEVVVVDLCEEEPTAKKKKHLFFNAKRVIDKKRKHKYVATIGAVLITLSIIGAIALCGTLINLAARVLDNTNQKEAFAWKVYPLLMLDPANFEDPNQLEDVFILKTSLWATLLENRLKYDYDENGMLLVPASDLDVAAKSLYGESVTLKHQTFSEGYDFFYLYDEETNIYSVPISGQTASYVPKVVEIKRSGDIYTLIVGYVAPTTLWNVTEDGSGQSVPDKYLYYDLEKIGYKDYIIKAVRSIPEDELPDDLEVSEMQQLNQTQYFDYDEIYQEQLNQQMQQGEGAENESTETSSGETSSSEETSSTSEE